MDFQLTNCTFLPEKDVSYIAKAGTVTITEDIIRIDGFTIYADQKDGASISGLIREFLDERVALIVP